jgi:hypothetical protein
MKQTWLDACLDLSAEPADFYSGARKILRNRTITFKRPFDGDRLVMADAGYTKSKMTMLIKNYLHAESKAVAIELWNKRIGQRKYGSVSFTCFAHFVKGGSVDAKRSKRASVFGPCIQSVCMTYMNNHTTEIDVFYRTTELFKKFPADLVFFQDVLMDGFDFSAAPVKVVRFHFANVTCHPMYFVTILPLLEDPIGELDAIKEKDLYFFNWIVKWSARYLVPEHHRGIQKFAQAMRVHHDATTRITKKAMKPLIAYLKKNHPGYRNDYVAPEEEDEE